MANKTAVDRVLSTEHAQLLLATADADLLSDLSGEIRRRSHSRSRCRRLASLAFKAVLLWSLLSVTSTLVFGQWPGLWQLLQNTEAFSRAELAYNQLLRKATVRLGLHNWELLHAMERDQCMLRNPFYKPKLRCCPCQKHRLVAAASAKPLRTGFDSLFDRMVSPFAYSNNSQPQVTFAELLAAVTADWDAVDSGSNRFRVLWPPQSQQAPPSLADLFQTPEAAEAPPSALAVAWLFGHLPAVRSLRRIVRRPDHVPDLAEDVLARQILFLGAGNHVPAAAAGDWIPLGDLGEIKGLAYAMALHGEVEIRLALKPQCCPNEVAAPGYRNITRRLGGGDVLGFMTDCYWVHIAKATEDAPAIVYLGSVYNGIHPTQALTKEKKSQPNVM